ncbi:MAG: type I DNA topoisomerase [Bacillota bacterium]
MGRSLVIVESPAKAKTVEKFLGRKYFVRASMGHVRDLPRSQMGVDLKTFEPKYITIRGKGEILKELREGVKKADRVLLATDPDREGEAISWHLATALGLDQGTNCRVEFNEITKEAVTLAIKSPRPIAQNLVDAQQARRILDRLVGYQLSPLLWRKVRRGLSAGRVQSVAVKLICDREREIADFVPKEYWTIAADLLTPRGELFRAEYYGEATQKRELGSGSEADAILADLREATYEVAEVKRRERRRYPATPFTTSTLQQEASRKLGFTVRRTMSIAQQLYEGLKIGDETVGLVTYIRTDSTRTAESARRDAANYINGRFGADYVLHGGGRRAKEGAQDAHEAIRPTAVGREPDRVREFLSRDQYRLYKLIWERFVASEMAPAVLDTVTVDIAAAGHRFRATGSTIKFPGFMALYIEGLDEARPDDDELILPELAEGEKLRLKGLTPEQHFTQPPPRYTEAMLVKTLEEKGIGRPSTYAPIIETIQQRGYVRREKKRFIPTELGLIVVELLEEYFQEIVDVGFTASLEKELDQIEEGTLNWRAVVGNFNERFEADLRRADEAIEKVEVPEEVSEVVCEKCGRQMVVKHGRYGRFLACPGFPECRNTKPLLETTGARCPVCGGEIVARVSKRHRRFYGCANYPECDFVTWYKPTADTCPRCKTFLVERRHRNGKTYLACANQDCGYRTEGRPVREGEE